MSKLVAYVLSGRNAGAELYLEPGSYTFGSSNEAYFTFDDPTVKELHLELELVLPQVEGEDLSKFNEDQIVERTEIFVLPLQGKVKVNSKAISERVKLQVGSLISFAFNEIMIALEGSDLNDLLRQAEEIKNKEYQERLDNALEQAKHSLQQELQAQYDNKLVEATKQAQEQARIEYENQKEAQAEGKGNVDGSQGKDASYNGLEASYGLDGNTKLVYDDRKVSLALWVATILGALLLATLIYLLVFASTGNTPEHNEQIVKNYLNSHYVEHINIDRDQGYLKVSGLVSSNEVKDKVLANLPTLDEVLVLNLKSYETILEDVRRAFELRGAVVRVDRTTDNHLHVFGYVQDALVEANLIASIKDILSNDALLNFASLSTSSNKMHTTQGAVINDGLVIEPHFMYERSMQKILQRLNDKHDLKLKYLYAPFDIAYLSDAQLETNPKYIALTKELYTLINGPVSLMDSPSLTYKYSLLKQGLATGKGLVFGENDRIAKRLSDTSLGADQSALLDYYQEALDKVTPYQKRIQEQSLATIYQSQANGMSKERSGVDLSSLYKKHKENSAQSPVKHYKGELTYGSADNSQYLLTDILSKINDSNSSSLPNTQKEDLESKSQSSVASDNKSHIFGLNENDANVGHTYEGETELKIEENLGLDVMGVTMMPLRFVSLRDGSKIFEGGMTPNGYIVKEIQVKHLILIDSSGKERLYELK